MNSVNYSYLLLCAVPSISIISLSTTNARERLRKRLLNTVMHESLLFLKAESHFMPVEGVFSNTRALIDNAMKKSLKYVFTSYTYIRDICMARKDCPLRKPGSTVLYKPHRPNGAIFYDRNRNKDNTDTLSYRNHLPQYTKIERCKAFQWN